MTTYNINQFSQTPVKGSLMLGLNVNVLSARIDPESEATDLVGGTAVKIVDVPGSIPTIDKAAEDDDIFGFIKYNIKNNTGYAPGEIAEVAFNFCAMIMEAGEGSIASGAFVEINPADDTIITWAGTNTIAGRTLEPATSGALIKVLINPIAPIGG